MEKARVLMGLSLALIGYIFLVDGAYQILIIIVAGLMALLALTLLLKEKFPPSLNKHLIDISENLDVGWLALGLGFFGVGIKCFQVQNQFRSEPLVWLGIIFILICALCIGNTIGIGGNSILKKNPKVLIIFGSVVLIVGLIWFVASWGTLNTNTLLGKLNASASQLLIMCMGIIFVYFGWRRNKKMSPSKSRRDDGVSNDKIDIIPGYITGQAITYFFLSYLFMKATAGLDKSFIHIDKPFFYMNKLSIVPLPALNIHINFYWVLVVIALFCLGVSLFFLVALFWRRGLTSKAKVLGYHLSVPFAIFVIFSFVVSFSDAFVSLTANIDNKVIVGIFGYVGMLFLYGLLILVIWNAIRYGRDMTSLTKKQANKKSNQA